MCIRKWPCRPQRAPRGAAKGGGRGAPASWGTRARGGPQQAGIWWAQGAPLHARTGRMDMDMGPWPRLAHAGVPGNRVQGGAPQLQRVLHAPAYCCGAFCHSWLIRSPLYGGSRALHSVAACVVKVCFVDAQDCACAWGHAAALAAGACMRCLPLPPAASIMYQRQCASFTAAPAGSTNSPDEVHVTVVDQQAGSGDAACKFRGCNSAVLTCAVTQYAVCCTPKGMHTGRAGTYMRPLALGPRTLRHRR